jgi:hypothetical protein
VFLGASVAVAGRAPVLIVAALAWLSWVLITAASDVRWA